MINFKARSDALGCIEAELKSEMAASLGRISRTLENLIGELQGIESRNLSDEMKDHYRHLHDQARLYYWYLIVQREAIGIRNHDSVLRHYRIPDKI